jgi:hypothetical protein
VPVTVGGGIFAQAKRIVPKQAEQRSRRCYYYEKEDTQNYRIYHKTEEESEEKPSLLGSPQGRRGDRGDHKENRSDAECPPSDFARSQASNQSDRDKPDSGHEPETTVRRF